MSIPSKNFSTYNSGSARKEKSSPLSSLMKTEETISIADKMRESGYLKSAETTAPKGVGYTGAIQLARKMQESGFLKGIDTSATKLEKVSMVSKVNALNSAIAPDEATKKQANLGLRPQSALRKVGEAPLEEAKDQSMVDKTNREVAAYGERNKNYFEQAKRSEGMNLRPTANEGEKLTGRPGIKDAGDTEPKKALQAYDETYIQPIFHASKEFYEGKANAGAVATEIQAQKETVVNLDKQITQTKKQLAEEEIKLENIERQAKGRDGFSAVISTQEKVVAELRKKAEDLEAERHSANIQLISLENKEKGYWGAAFAAKQQDKNAADKIEAGKVRLKEEKSKWSEAYKTKKEYAAVSVPKPVSTDPRYASGAATAQNVAAREARIAAYKEFPLAADTSHMTEEELDVLYYLVGAGYDEMAAEYIQQTALEGRRERLKEIEDWAGKNFGTGVLATVQYSTMMPVAGWDFLTARNRYAQTGLTANQKLGPGAVRDALSGGVSMSLNEWSGTLPEKLPVVGGKGAGDLYQLGLSMGESYGSAMAFGKYATIFLGLSAASSAYNDAINRGASVEQAQAVGTLSGISEALFEYASIDRFLNGKSASKWIVDALVQAGVEGSEELLTSAANRITDNHVMGLLSNRNLAIEEYMKNGMSHEAAAEKATKEFYNQLAYDFFGGFVSGGVMGGAQSATKYARANAFVDTIMRKPDSKAYEMVAKAANVNGSETEQEASQKIKKWYLDDENASNVASEAVKIYSDEISKDIKNISEEAKAVTTQQQETQRQTEIRAEQVHQNNPDSTVISSSGTQAYLDLGADLKTAQAAGSVLDGIVAGTISSDNMSNSQATALQLDTQRGVDAVKNVLGVEVNRAVTKSEARSLAKSAARSYEETAKNAVATQEFEAQQEPQDIEGQGDVYDALSAQSQEMAQDALRKGVMSQPSQVNVETQPVVIPRKQEPKATVSQSVAERSSLDSRPSVSGRVSETAMRYKEFSEEYTSLIKSASKADLIALHDKYVDVESSNHNTLTPLQFEVEYRRQNQKAKKKDVALAYQQYLESAWNRQSKNAGERSGLVHNEYSEQVSTEIAEAVDSLGKLFNLSIRFADLSAQNDNGRYILGTNEVLLDIDPRKAGTKNAFLFTVSHEIGHAAKERLTAEQWASFEKVAIKAMGGEAIVKAKQAEDAAYQNESIAREDVACDFIGKILSDKATLDTFCEAIRSGEVHKETARGFMAAVRKILGRLRGKGIKQFDAVTKQLAEKAAKQFGVDLETAENAVKEMQKALSEAARDKDPTKNSDIRFSMKNGAGSGNDTKLNIDNAEESSYNGSKKNGGALDGETANGNRVDRGVAEGISLRQVSGRAEASERHGKDGRGDQELPGVLRITSELDKAFKERGVVATELYDYSGDSAAYSYSLDAARNADKDNGWCVTPQTTEDLEGKLLRMDATQSIGYVLSSGDIEGVFKNKKKTKRKGMLESVMPQAIAEGGNKLDCYGDGLVAVYEAYGFIPVARVEFNPEYANPGWDESKGRPHIYMMMHNGDSAETVVRNIGQYEHMSLEQLEALPTYDKNGYDDAAAYRDRVMAERGMRYSKKDSSGRKADRLSSLSPAAQQRATEASERNSKKTMEEFVDEFGRIAPGEKPFRDIPVAKSVEGGTKVSQTARTALEAKVTNENMVPVIEESIIEGAFSYKPKKNAERYERVRKSMQLQSVDAALESWNRDIGAGKTDADVVAKGMILYNNYATAAQKATDENERRIASQTAVRILSDLSAIVRRGAQATQMIRMLKEQSPEMQLYSLEHSVAKLQETIYEQFEGKKKNAPEIQIDEELASKWIGAIRSGDQEKASAIADELHKSIAQQIPKTFMDIWNAWRYLSMLGNFKTIIRNTIGNVSFAPMKTTKDAIGSLAEWGAEKFGWIDKAKRTKSVGVMVTKKGRALMEYAKADFASSEVSDLFDAMQIGKYNDSSAEGKLASAIADAKRTFRINDKNLFTKAVSSAVVGWQSATDYLMNEAPLISDKAFMKKHYMNSFAKAAAARGYTSDMLRSNDITREQLDDIRAYAVRQALKATFRDANIVSEAIVKFKPKGKTPTGKALNFAVEGIIPFKGTPANVLVRAAEYSPVGLLKAVSFDIAALVTGKITATEYLDRLTAGLTGSGIFALGALLSSLGIIVLKADEDDEREGRQNYSIEIGDTSISLDWLAPAAIPFFMGAEVQRAFGEADGMGTIGYIIDGFGRTFEPMLEMSMLSGIQDVFDTLSLGSQDVDFASIVAAFFVQPFVSYIGQALPTMLGQIANTLEKNRTSTYVGDIDGSIARNFVRSIARLTEKIPGVDWRQIEYVDAWGREDENGNIFARFANNFLNPAYVAKINQTDVDAEIRRLEESTGKNISPARRGYTITVSEYDEDGEKTYSEKVTLSAEEYERYAREYGEQAALMMFALTTSEYYDSLSDSDKVKAFEQIYDLADEYGKLAADVGYILPPSDSERKFYDLVEAGVPIAEAYSAKLYRDQLEDDSTIGVADKPEIFRNWVYNNKSWTRDQKDLIVKNFGSFRTGQTIVPEKYDAMIEGGIPSSVALNITTGVRALKPLDGKESVTALQRWELVIDEANKANLTDAQVDAALRQYISEDELVHYEACYNAGVTARDYVAVCKAVSELKPLEDQLGIIDAQKVAVCVKMINTTEGQDAFIKKYLDKDGDAKYESVRAAGVSPADYSKFMNARISYAGGSWSKAELKTWLRKQKHLSNKMKAALWAAANSKWAKTDPNGWRS